MQSANKIIKTSAQLFNGKVSEAMNHQGGKKKKMQLFCKQPNSCT
jgi:hypothetical protein